MQLSSIASPRMGPKSRIYLNSDDDELDFGADRPTQARNIERTDPPVYRIKPETADKLQAEDVTRTIRRLLGARTSPTLVESVEVSSSDTEPSEGPRATSIAEQIIEETGTSSESEPGPAPSKASAVQCAAQAGLTTPSLAQQHLASYLQTASGTRVKSSSGKSARRLSRKRGNSSASMLTASEKK